MTTGNLPIIGRAWTPNEAPPLPLPPEARPALSRWVRRAGLERGEIELGPPDPAAPPWEVLRLEGEGAGEAARVLGLLDGRGRRTLRALAEEAGRDLEEVTAFIQGLYHRGVIAEEGDVELPALPFYLHLKGAATLAWRGFGASPLLDRVERGPFPRRLALGFLLENYHFAMAAASHQGAAVAAMPTVRLKTAFSEHLSLEYWHYAWLRGGLEAAGLSAEDLDAASPLPSLLGLINHLRWLAVGDPLAYSACIGVGEGGPDTLAPTRRFWEQFTAHGALPEAAYGPFREHDLGDAGDDHTSFGGEAFAESGGLPAAARARIRQRVLAYSRQAFGFHRELVEFYGAAEGPAFFSVEG